MFGCEVGATVACQFAKHVLKTKHYFRYCDDFIFVHKNKKFLEDRKASKSKEKFNEVTKNPPKGIFCVL